MDFKLGDYVECEYYVGKITTMDKITMEVEVLYHYNVMPKNSFSHSPVNGKMYDQMSIKSAFATNELKLLQVKWKDFETLHGVLYD